MRNLKTVAIYKNTHSSITKKTALVMLLVLCPACITLASSCTADKEQNDSVIYIAWSNKQDSYSFTSTLKTVEATGAKPVVLDMAKAADLDYDEEGKLSSSVDEHGILTSEAAAGVKQNTWKGSNAEEIMEGVDCVIFPGGSDICPTLYRNEQGWHGIEGDTDYSAERDVSDYILMSYCLDHDIPMLAICRGMQMLSIVSGAEMIQDIPSWQESKGIRSTILHRDPDKKVFEPHDVTLTSEDSLLYQITGADTITDVPSWHHQGVESVDGTKLQVTAYAGEGSEQLIEGVERPDLTFCVGIQFHSEVAVRKYIDEEEDAEDFMDYDTALSLFKALKDSKAN